MKVVTIEIPDDSELIKEGNIYKICRVIPKTWEEFCNRTPIRQEYFIGYDSKINLRENICENDIRNRKINTFKCLVSGDISLSWNKNNILNL